MANIEVIGLTKRFGPVDAVAAIDLSIDDGEFVVLVGPSGCGKSTLLRLIAGLETGTAGTIIIDGRDVTRAPAKARDIAMVFQSYALYPHMSVAQNMGFNLLVKGMPRESIDEQVRQAAAIVNLSNHLSHKPAQLSGGQRQRVAMGRAIIRNPKVFLFDEPLSNLDAQLRVAMRAEIKELQRKLATTTIYVTHDQVEAMTMADRIVIMREGCIEQVGPPLQLYDNPVNTFVARFIGSPAMNLLPGKLVRNGRLMTVLLDGGAIFDAPVNCSGSDGQLVHFGIRPEHLAIKASGKGLTGDVVGIESTGAQVIIQMQYDSHRIMAALNDRTFPEIGSKVILTSHEKNYHIFDFHTGHSLLPVSSTRLTEEKQMICPK